MEIKLILATIIIISTTMATPQALGPLIILWSQYRNYLTSPLNTGTSNKQQVSYKNYIKSPSYLIFFSEKGKQGSK